MMRAHTYTNTQHILHKYTTHIDLKKTFIDYTYFMNPNDSSTPRQLMRTPRRLIYANILAREHPNLFNAPSTQVQATGSQIESPIGLRGLTFAPQAEWRSESEARFAFVSSLFVAQALSGQSPLGRSDFPTS